eukprot:CAMPEP_0206240154 /NCGR_PEP_ID=MMETSP0047_2-20121206/15784_1 /ASSEMBLY_ACC=CAM_ASM_000192 /TAXON_ID=195065 /ORGANISM="Chroomonas mesostigmatica_cf, Strain CCMP1168" /LENGTH=1263 /DNA_ID=CAMNT_0053664911 /DNA_START=139 /DNA_END=3931 /DNA_ORIENTATION=-
MARATNVALLLLSASTLCCALVPRASFARPPLSPPSGHSVAPPPTGAVRGQDRGASLVGRLLSGLGLDAGSSAPQAPAPAPDFLQIKIVAGDCLPKSGGLLHRTKYTSYAVGSIVPADGLSRASSPKFMTRKSRVKTVRPVWDSDETIVEAQRDGIFRVTVYRARSMMTDVAIGEARVAVEDIVHLVQHKGHYDAWLPLYDPYTGQQVIETKGKNAGKPSMVLVHFKRFSPPPSSAGGDLRAKERAVFHPQLAEAGTGAPDKSPDVRGRTRSRSESRRMRRQRRRAEAQRQQAEEEAEAIKRRRAAVSAQIREEADQWRKRIENRTASLADTEERTDEAAEWTRQVRQKVESAQHEEAAKQHADTAEARVAEWAEQVKRKLEDAVKAEAEERGVEERRKQLEAQHATELAKRRAEAEAALAADEAKRREEAEAAKRREEEEARASASGLFSPERTRELITQMLAQKEDDKAFSEVAKEEEAACGGQSASPSQHSECSAHAKESKAPEKAEEADAQEAASAPPKYYSPEQTVQLISKMLDKSKEEVQRAAQAERGETVPERAQQQQEEEEEGGQEEEQGQDEEQELVQEEEQVQEEQDEGGVEESSQERMCGGQGGGFPERTARECGGRCGECEEREFPEDSQEGDQEHGDVEEGTSRQEEEGEVSDKEAHAPCSDASDRRCATGEEDGSEPHPEGCRCLFERQCEQGRCACCEHEVKEEEEQEDECCEECAEDDQDSAFEQEHIGRDARMHMCPANYGEEGHGQCPIGFGAPRVGEFVTEAARGMSPLRRDLENAARLSGVKAFGRPLLVPRSVCPSFAQQGRPHLSAPAIKGAARDTAPQRGEFLGNEYVETTLYSTKSLLKQRMGTKSRDTPYIEGTLHDTADLLKCTMSKSQPLAFPKGHEADSPAEADPSKDARRLKTMRVLARWVREFQTMARNGEERVKELECRVERQKESLFTASQEAQRLRGQVLIRNRIVQAGHRIIRALVEDNAALRQQLGCTTAQRSPSDTTRLLAVCPDRSPSERAILLSRGPDVPSPSESARLLLRDLAACKNKTEGPPAGHTPAGSEYVESTLYKTKELLDRSMQACENKAYGGCMAVPCEDQAHAHEESDSTEETSREAVLRDESEEEPRRAAGDAAEDEPSEREAVLRESDEEACEMAQRWQQQQEEACQAYQQYMAEQHACSKAPEPSQRAIPAMQIGQIEGEPWPAPPMHTHVPSLKKMRGRSRSRSHSGGGDGSPRMWSNAARQLCERDTSLDF